MHHRVHDALVPEPVTGPGARQQVRRLGHRLHAAGDDDRRLAGLDHEVGEVNGVEPRQAHLVHGRRRRDHRYAAAHGRLAGGDLALAGAEHLAHQDVVDGFRGDAGPFECGCDGETAQVHGCETSKSTCELADRCACA